MEVMNGPFFTNTLILPAVVGEKISPLAFRLLLFILGPQSTPQWHAVFLNQRLLLPTFGEQAQFQKTVGLWMEKR